MIKRVGLPSPGASFLLAHSLVRLGHPARPVLPVRAPGPEDRRARDVGFSSICQDEEGFLWLGTSAGLARYDGYRFKFYPPPVGARPASPGRRDLPGDDLPSGEIWIGTNGQGLLMFSKETEEFVQYRHDARDPDSLTDDIVLAVQEDPKGDLVGGDALARPRRFDRRRAPSRRVPLGPDADVVWDVLADQEGRHLGRHARRRAVQDRSRDRRNGQFPASRADDPRSLGSDSVWTIFEDREGRSGSGRRAGA